MAASPRRSVPPRRALRERPQERSPVLCARLPDSSRRPEKRSPLRPPLAGRGARPGKVGRRRATGRARAPRVARQHRGEPLRRRELAREERDRARRLRERVAQREGVVERQSGLMLSSTSRSAWSGKPCSQRTRADVIRAVTPWSNWKRMMCERIAARRSGQHALDALTRPGLVPKEVQRRGGHPVADEPVRALRRASLEPPRQLQRLPELPVVHAVRPEPPERAELVVRSPSPSASPTVVLQPVALFRFAAGCTCPDSRAPRRDASRAVRPRRAPGSGSGAPARRGPDPR